MAQQQRYHLFMFLILFLFFHVFHSLFLVVKPVQIDRCAEQ
jgi:hypothetical protein